MTNTNDYKAISKAVSSCAEFQEFKAKWDGRIPRSNSKAFVQYQKDATAAQKAINQAITVAQERAS